MNAVISEATPMWLISANDLLSGEVVYLADHGRWTRELAEAVYIDSRTAAEEAQQTAQSQQHDTVVGPMIVGASYSASENALMLNHYRDRFRESGPTHRSQLAREVAHKQVSTGSIAARPVARATGVA